MESGDRTVVGALQAYLSYADPDAIEAAIYGIFLGMIAVDRERIVGYAIAFPDRPVTLSELVVVPDARRSGFGQRLVEAVISATDADQIVVRTPVENRTARRFYAELGFEGVEIEPDFYADGTAALRLARRE